MCRDDCSRKPTGERIIIRTSLAHRLPHVTADTRTLRQVVLDLIATSIRLNHAGGQVIVSTALTDNGDVALRVPRYRRGPERVRISVPQPNLTAWRQTPSKAAPSVAGISLALTARAGRGQPRADSIFAARRNPAR